MRYLLVLLVWVGVVQVAIAQLPNTVFYDSLNAPAHEGDLDLELNSLGFLRNTEYFNKYQLGSTLFGMHLVPKLKYQVGNGLSLHAGAFIRQDFGSGGVQWAEPLFTIRYDHGPFSLLFGSIEGALRHNLSEPLYDFEIMFRRRFEQGIQFKWSTERLFAEAWIDWQRATYQGSQTKEAFWAGSTGSWAIAKSRRWTTEVAWQITAYHVGGQLDTTSLPTVTQTNLSPILRIQHHSGENTLKAEYQLINQQSSGSFTTVAPGRSFAQLATLSFHRKGLCLMLNYWTTDGFYSLQGGPIYQSFSVIYPNPPQVDPKRNLLWLRVMADIPLAPATTLTLRAEPFYDFSSGALEYAYGFYINSRIGQTIFRIK